MARTSNSGIINKYRKKLTNLVVGDKKKNTTTLWTRMIDMYRGKHYVESEEDRLLVNIAFATINVIAPGVSLTIQKLLLMPENLKMPLGLLLQKRL
jgi:hypothetical protein